MKVWKLTVTDKYGYGFEAYSIALYTTKAVAEEAARISQEEDGPGYAYEIEETTVHASATFDVMIVPLEDE
jgi:hypothetical protein